MDTTEFLGISQSNLERNKCCFPAYCFTLKAKQIDSPRRRANARNLSFRISLRWPIHIIKPVDKTKLPCYTSHRRRTTVSLETYPYKTDNRRAQYHGYKTGVACLIQIGFVSLLFV